MAHAYTPGLRVAELTVLRKVRRLPIKGEVLVAKGDAVTSDTVVARTHLPGNGQLVNVASKLGRPPEDLPSLKHRRLGPTEQQATVGGRQRLPAPGGERDGDDRRA